MAILFILNEGPYGSEKTYNALRLAMALQKDHPGTEVRMFPMQKSLIPPYSQSFPGASRFSKTVMLATCRKASINSVSNPSNSR